MPRAFHIPGVIFLFCAFVLLFLVSISLPYITALDVARVHFHAGSPTINQDSAAANELRVSTRSTSWQFLHARLTDASRVSPISSGPGKPTAA